MHKMAKFLGQNLEVPQLGYHAITVLHGSSAQIENLCLLVVTCCYSSSKIEAVSLTTCA
jgi:hypothetical protein